MKKPTLPASVAPALAALMLGPILGIGQTSMAATANYTFKTDIQEVHAGNVDGQDILTIQIPGNVGPAGCRGNVLKLQVNESRNQQIGNIAFSAMLQSDPVMITIPLALSQCVDGKPTVLDMVLIPS